MFQLHLFGEDTRDGRLRLNSCFVPEEMARWFKKFWGWIATLTLCFSMLHSVNATKIFISKDCWEGDCGPRHSIASVNVGGLSPEKPNVDSLHEWKHMHVMKDWNLTWVSEQKSIVSNTLSQLSDDVTFLVSHKDGDSISYHFLRDTVKSHPYLRFIVVCELSKASPITAALIMKEARDHPNVKLLSTQLSATNLFHIKLAASKMVSSLYTMVREMAVLDS